MKQQIDKDLRRRCGVEQEYVEAFQDGDFETRLALYLNYRELRNQFAEIEERELSTGGMKGRC